MKVKIGPYLTWWGPYQIAELLFGNPPKHVYEESELTWRHRGAERLGTWLASTWVADACQWVQDHRRRRVYVHVDNYDTWSADHTLSLIALPLLQKLQTHKHGAPHVDDCDVPLHLRSTSAPPKENEWDVDANHFDRWDWVLGEMIWAHYQEANDNPGEEECWTHNLPDPRWPYPAEGSGLDQMLGRIRCDDTKLQAFNERKQNGFRLFGKYYQALWD